MRAAGTPEGTPQPAPALLVLDTNIVLDMLVFGEPTVAPLHAALADGSARWLTTHAMRAEFLRVLAYPQIAVRVRARALVVDDLLAQFDRWSRVVDAAPAASVRCQDRDDQIFIDLALAWKAALWSKDGAVLRLRKRLANMGVAVQSPG